MTRGATGAERPGGRRRGGLPRRSAVVVALAGLAALAACVAPAAAFSAFPAEDNPHRSITVEGARRGGWPRDLASQLVEGARWPDLMEGALDPRAQAPPPEELRYEPWHHCDRPPGGKDADLLQATSAYVGRQMGAARDHLDLGNRDGAILALGRALHAAQDCMSHSNVVDLDAVHQAALLAALAKGETVPDDVASRVTLTGFDPEAPDPHWPEGDPWPHGLHAKDEPDGNEASRETLADGRTRHQAAHDLAVDLTADLVRGFLGGLADDQMEVLAPPDASARMTPGPGVAAVAALAACTYVRRRIAATTAP